MTAWLLEFPAPTSWVSANHRTRHLWQTKERRMWRDATHTWAKAAKLPKGLPRVHITATLSFPDNRRRDVSNYSLTVKACVDGLVDYGLISDDDDKHLTGPDLRRGELSTVALGWLALEIRKEETK